MPPPTPGPDPTGPPRSSERIVGEVLRALGASHLPYEVDPENLPQILGYPDENTSAREHLLRR